MKPIQLIRCGVALLATTALSSIATAQTTVTTTTGDGRAVVTTGGERVVTTTTRVGRVGTVTPDTLVMDAAAGTEPIPYVRTSRTVYVDEAGAVVPVEMVRAGSPVTVHYSRDADRYIADRVVVHRTATVQPAPAVIERSTVVEPARRPAVIRKETTTTTTTAEPATRTRVVVDEDDDVDIDD